MNAAPAKERLVDLFSTRPVRSDPFPHVLADDYLPADLYGELLQSFPACPANSGPTGFSVFRGDALFDELMDASPAWRGLFEAFNSQRFVDHAIAQFAPVFAAEAQVPLDEAVHVDFVETRREKERRHLTRIEHEADALWVRFDVLQGRQGYGRGVHLDHRRRAATALIYFCDAEESGLEGGDLLLHDAAGAAVATIRPRHNRMVMFPCHNGSRHSVSPIRAQSGPRNFLQITLSSSIDLWEPVPEPERVGLAARAAAAGRRLLASVERRAG